jgi:hypothetical protein
MTQPSAAATLAPLTNVGATLSAMLSAMDRVNGLPGLVCLYGRSGYGKSSAAAYTANQTRAYYVELKSLWSTKHILINILRDMGILPANTVAEMLDQVCEQLSLSNRPLIIDQADYLVDKGRAQILMDIYEGSKAPILFIGEERLSTAMKARNNTVHRRVLHWIEAQPASLGDCQALARLYCPGLDVGEDLLAHINRVVEGCTGRVAVNLNLLAERAKVHGWARADLASWKGQSAADQRLYTGEPGRK